jgi:nitroimidazol reductase NimA-like FMN-containing flavoprotein (pyridoxamine 5'-phosphate oxidase superfamily)
MLDFEQTRQNTVVRAPDRGAYDRATIYRIIDEALICHVGLVQEEQPFVIPTLHARWDDHILLHGATKSRLIRHVQAGNAICLTMTIVDGLVLAKSVFHHSINYRSVVLFGQGSLVESDQAKFDALRIFTEQIMPGRWQDARVPNEKELKATGVVSIPIDSASAKVRIGPPVDDDEDLPLPVWAGVLPVKQQVGLPLNDPNLRTDIPLPDYVKRYIETQKD